MTDSDRSPQPANKPTVQPSEQPIDKPALNAAVTALVQKGWNDRALNTLDEALEQLPDDLQLKLRRTVLLRDLGRHDESVEQLSGMYREKPHVPALAWELAASLRAAGRTAASLQLIEQILEARPEDRRAWVEKVQTLLRDERFDEALTTAQDALERHPEDLMLMLRKGTALRGLGRLDEAFEHHRAMMDQFPGQAAVIGEFASVLRAMGRFEQAEDILAAALRETPDKLIFWIGRIELAFERGDAELALRHCDAALGHLPNHRRLLLRKSALLKGLEKPHTAVKLLEEALDHAPTDPSHLSTLAQLYYHVGEPEKAADTLAALPGKATDDEMGVLKQAEVAVIRGEPAKALGILAQAIDFEALAADPLAPLSVPIAVHFCELATYAGQDDRVRLVLAHLSREPARIPQSFLMSLFQLGERWESMPIALAVLDQIAQRPSITPMLAKFMIRRAHMALTRDETMRLAKALERRLKRENQAEFQVFVTSVVVGPDAALALSRSLLSEATSHTQATIIAEQLLGAGRFGLAVRYLSRCARRWPNVAVFRQLFLRACDGEGALYKGHAFLDALEAMNPELDIGLLRIELFIMGSDLDSAASLIETRRRKGLKVPEALKLHELYVALGRVEQAEEITRSVKWARNAGPQTANHFGSTLFGSRFNELRLYRQSLETLAARGMSEAEANKSLAENFFFPAKCIVDDFFKDQPPIPGDAQGIPHRVMQYWNVLDVPEDVQTVMQSWAAEGFEHHCYSRSEALSFLRKTYPPAFVRAFGLANSVTEECDFLRLCLLYKFGGIYADADDRLTGDPKALLGHGAGMIVMRERHGSIANNIICARAQHPVLKIAIALACRSLLQRENDSTWAKTGPGLLTRAIALYLSRTPLPESRADLTILPPDALNRYVHPHVRLSYKSTPLYWNARDSRVPKEIISAFSRIV